MKLMPWEYARAFFKDVFFLIIWLNEISALILFDNFNFFLENVILVLRLVVFKII
jgi:hypothetical protein